MKYIISFSFVRTGFFVGIEANHWDYYLGIFLLDFLIPFKTFDFEYVGSASTLPLPYLHLLLLIPS